jgi:P-type E1-E2 ATPase
MLALMNFVAISLLVSLEMVKFWQGIFIEWDAMIFDEEKGMSAKAQSSNLNEELGTVNYIFSDKTGTLTEDGLQVYGFRGVQQAIINQRKKHIFGNFTNDCRAYQP